MRARPQVRVPVPGLVREVGLGRVIAAVTSALGVRPCPGCRERAAKLDERIVFRGLRRHRADDGERE